MIEVERIWYDEYGNIAYRDKHKFKTFTGLIAWLNRQGLLEMFVEAFKANKGTDVILSLPDGVVTIWKLPVGDEFVKMLD